MQIKRGFILREVGEEHIVVPVGEASKNFHGMVKLNDVGAFLWQFFTVEHSKEDAVNAILAEFEGAERAEVEEDVEAFTRLLIDNGFAQ